MNRWSNRRPTPTRSKDCSLRTWDISILPGRKYTSSELKTGEADGCGSRFELIERIRQRDRPPIFPAFLRDVNGGYLKEIAPQPGRPVRREHSFCQRKGVPVRKNKRETGKGNAHLGPRHIQIRLRQHVGERLINPEDLSPVDFKIYKRSHAFRQSDSRFPGGTSVRVFCVRSSAFFKEEPLDLRIPLDFISVQNSARILEPRPSAHLHGNLAAEFLNAGQERREAFVRERRRMHRRRTVVEI